MNEIKIFESEQFGKIRTVLSESGEPMFCLVDVAKALGYSRPADAVSQHCKGVCVLPTPTTGGVQQVKFGKEGEVYRLTMRSKLPDAEKFQDWVCDEVLPSIRKNGGYISTSESDTPDVIMARALILAQETIANHERKMKELEERNNMLVHQKKLFTTTEIAKELNMRSAKELNDLLIKMKVQFKQNDTWILYSKYADKNYVSIKQEVLDNGKIIYYRKWTGIGREFILKLLK